jgi:plasmid stabilization system protein ParE
METYRIILSPEAYSDLDQIYQYIAHDSEKNAAAMISQILDAIDALAIVPHHNVAANMPHSHEARDTYDRGAGQLRTHHRRQRRYLRQLDAMGVA